MKRLLTIALLAVSACFVTSVRADEPAAPAKKAMFVYVLHLVPRLYDQNAWTKEDGEVIGRHFQRLKDATAAGMVAFAGRTLDEGDRSFGIVVFEAAGADEARTFADGDPAVMGGLMTVDVHPFALVLQRGATAP